MNVAQILDAFPKLAALVVGDICLDRWCEYEPSAGEPSRETGIPRIGIVSTEVTPGAGGTVANNLAALGAARVAVLGMIGDDGFGWELERELERRGISAALCVRAPGRQTFTYTKLLNSSTGVEDLPRVDFISIEPLGADVEHQMLDSLRRVHKEYDVILVSDQAETECGGVVTPALREALAAIAEQHPQKVVWVDSRLRAHLFRRVILKPNQREAEETCRRLFGSVDYERLRAHVDAPLVVVTHGPEGALLVDRERQTWVRTHAVAEPVDICGAGDSFSAGAALALAVTGSPIDAARFGNLAASVTIMKKGTGTATPREVLEAASRMEE